MSLQDDDIRSYQKHIFFHASLLKHTKFTLHDIPIISNAGIFTNFQSDASVFFVSSEGGAVGNKENSTSICDLILNHLQTSLELVLQQTNLNSLYAKQGCKSDV